MFGIKKRRELINKSTIKDFIDLYAREDNWHGLDPIRGGLGYGWIHYSLIRQTKPEKVLCIGSRWGFIPAVCAMACKDNEKGKVMFVDAGFDMSESEGPGDHWGGMGWWKRCKPKEYFGRFGLEKFLELWVMKTSEYYQNNKKEEYGYIHIDGDHSYQGVKYDFETFWPRLRKGGFIALHDIGSQDKDGNVYGTRSYWQEIVNKTGVKAIEIMEDPGLGIIQKR